MAQEGRWLARYSEVIDFLEKNHRNPSHHRFEEHLFLNFVKHNRKLMNKGEGMKNERVEKFKGPFAMYEECKRKNRR